MEKQVTSMRKTRKKNFTIKHSENLCCKLNPYLNSFLNDNEWASEEISHVVDAYHLIIYQEAPDISILAQS